MEFNLTTCFKYTSMFVALAVFITTTWLTLEAASMQGDINQMTDLLQADTATTFEYNGNGPECTHFEVGVNCTETTGLTITNTDGEYETIDFHNKDGSLNAAGTEQLKEINGWVGQYEENLANNQALQQGRNCNTLDKLISAAEKKQSVYTQVAATGGYVTAGAAVATKRIEMHIKNDKKQEELDQSMEDLKNAVRGVISREHALRRQNSTQFQPREGKGFQVKKTGLKFEWGSFSLTLTQFAIGLIFTIITFTLFFGASPEFAFRNGLVHSVGLGALCYCGINLWNACWMPVTYNQAKKAETTENLLAQKKLENYNKGLSDNDMVEGSQTQSGVPAFFHAVRDANLEYSKAFPMPAVAVENTHTPTNYEEEVANREDEQQRFFDDSDASSSFDSDLQLPEGATPLLRLQSKIVADSYEVIGNQRVARIN